MKKLFRNFIITAMGTVVFTANGYAAELNYNGANANPSQAHLHFVGDIQTNLAGRTATMFILKPNTVLDNTSGVLNDNILFVDSASVEFEGGYEFEFDFKPEAVNDEKYPVYVVCGDFVYTYEYEYKSWDDIMTLLQKIKDKGITYSELEEYFDALGLKNEVFTESEYTEDIIEKINGLTDASASGVDMLKDCFNNSIKEFELLKSIASLNNWSDVQEVISQISTLTGTKFSYGNSDKEAVLKDIFNKAVKGTIYHNDDELKKDFDKFVKENPKKNQSLPGGGGNSSGSVGGSTNSKFPSSNIANNPIEVNTESFDDLAQVQWAKEAIENLYKRGIINGVGDKKFAPMRNITREEFVKLAVVAFGIYDTAQKADFEDTDSEAWYSVYIGSAKKAGIVNGVSETEFGLGRNITRQDMAVILYNAAKKNGYTFGEAGLEFTDNAQIADYAKEAVGALSSQNVINGMEDGSFRPYENATRAQAAKMIYSLIGGGNI